MEGGAGCRAPRNPYTISLVPSNAGKEDLGWPCSRLAQAQRASLHPPGWSPTIQFHPPQWPCLGKSSATWHWSKAEESGSKAKSLRRVQPQPGPGVTHMAGDTVCKQAMGTILGTQCHWVTYPIATIPVPLGPTDLEMQPWASWGARLPCQVPHFLPMLSPSLVTCLLPCDYQCLGLFLY